ncbi:hypothetical protein AUCHE_04_01040 [Austwickia chelonae NBRC 105200]|uniref:Uncharacterized protein n=1 Tax=Austwickia chelonae NBRC 105200 TaxID=1184607 RepID=K6V4K6_9MICO|nr:hypothetical protein AUCHE_04_01040 [Austwickia chelonae NBRC 105200]
MKSPYCIRDSFSLEWRPRLPGPQALNPEADRESGNQKEYVMQNEVIQVMTEIEETEQLAHESASHSNALVENPFD